MTYNESQEGGVLRERRGSGQARGGTQSTGWGVFCAGGAEDDVRRKVSRTRNLESLQGKHPWRELPAKRPYPLSSDDGTPLKGLKNSNGELRPEHGLDCLIGVGRGWSVFCAGSHVRLIDACITQRTAQRPYRTCTESNEEDEGVLHERRSGARCATPDTCQEHQRDA